MNADLSEILRLLQNMIRPGTIAEVDGAKARVMLSPKLTTEWLNWAALRAGTTRTWSAPTVGEQVLVLSPGGDLTRGMILPAMYSNDHDAPENDGAIHAIHYPDGAVIRYDHAAHLLSANLPGGTAIIIADKVTSDAPNTICTGDLTVKGSLLVEHDATVTGATALNGGASAKAGAAGGPAVAVQGSVKASDDVLAGAVSLAKHLHSGIKAGSDKSGGPL